jgi:acyl-CoA dehydrogenase
MDFAYTPKTQEILARVQKFMDDYIVPRIGQYNEEVHPAITRFPSWPTCVN